MSSSAERFWKMAVRWEIEKSHIGVECRSPFDFAVFLARVSKVSPGKKSLTLVSLKAGEERELDLRLADFRIETFAPLGEGDRPLEDDPIAVVSIIWEGDSSSLRKLTELRGKGPLV